MRRYSIWFAIMAMAVFSFQNVYALQTTAASIDAKVKALYKQSYSYYMWKKTGGTSEFRTTYSLKVYKDAAEKIRIVRQVASGDFSVEWAAYYDESGNLMLYINNRPEGSCRMYFSQGTSIQKDGIAEYSPNEYLKYLKVSDLPVKFPEEMGGLTKKGTVSFAPLSVGVWTTTLSMDVNLRASASSSGKVVRKINAYDSVRIIEIGKKETIGSYGKNYWYKVNGYDAAKATGYEGWVYGAFLLPAEM